MVDDVHLPPCFLLLKTRNFGKDVLFDVKGVWMDCSHE